ncbi:MAG TPA: hypothetical protein VGL42_04400 [Opitutaceae bacterium]|jgi:hypothetical protein
MSADPYEHARRPVETKDASIRVIGLTAGCIILLIATGLVLGVAMGGLKAGVRRGPEPEQFRHGPQAVPDVVAEWPAIDREVREHLDTYGWVDRQTGVVRIPIDQAMKRLAQPAEAP